MQEVIKKERAQTSGNVTTFSNAGPVCDLGMRPNSDRRVMYMYILGAAEDSRAGLRDHAHSSILNSNCHHISILIY